jgi:hypothetical protein
MSQEIHRVEERTRLPSDAFGLLRSYTRHLAFVRDTLASVGHALERRAIRHDASKMLDDEFAGFSRINAAARVHRFGSPEYADGMRRERETIEAHFRRNSHHPEFHAMTFLDVIEMVCDWRGAQLGYDDPRPWRESFDLNIRAKGGHLSPEQLWLARQVADFIERGDVVEPTP